MSIGSAIGSLLNELHRRRVFRVAGLYIVGAWVVMQAADVFLPAWGIPDQALRALFYAALAGFPIALIFGWLFDVGPEGITRTPPVTAEDRAESVRLGRADYLILAALTVVAALIVYQAVLGLLETPVEGPIVAATAEAPDNAIAVLPFANMSSDPDNEYFADGLSEEILHRLAEFPELHVIARTSSFVFKHSDFDVPRIAVTLGVSYLLQGSVRKQGDDLRITAQLVDQTGRQLWSDSFDRKFESVFDLQRDLAESVATTVVPRIAPPKARSRQPDIAAYQHYLIGREYLRNQVANWDNLAAAEFRKAIAIDPDYAEAHAELAGALAAARDREWHLAEQQTTQQKHAEAEREIQAALALDPNLARAYAVKGFLHGVREEHDQAATALRRAVALDPNMADAAWRLIPYVGDSPEERWKLLQKTARLDPVFPSLNNQLANGYARRGQFAEAMATFDRLLAGPEPGPWTYHYADRFLAGTGQLAAGLGACKRLVESVLDTGTRMQNFGLSHIAQAYARMGEMERAAEWEGRKAAPTYFDALSMAYGGRYEAILESWDDLMMAEGKTPNDLHPWFRGYYGETQALAGHHQEAIATLTSFIEPLFDRSDVWGVPQLGLVYAYQQSGQGELALPFLEELQGGWRDLEEKGLLHFGPDLAEYALVQVLAGELSSAMQLLERAYAAGWRGYYPVVHDPRWDPVRSDPRFQDILEKIKIDVDVQRAEVARQDAADGYAERIDRMIRSEESPTTR